MIYLLWSTCRPLVMIDTHDHWMSNSVHPGDIKTLVAVDTEEDAAQLIHKFNITIACNPRGGVVKPLHCLVENIVAEDNDILVVPSDDFYAPANWDMIIQENMHQGDGVLKVNDGHMDDIVSIPIMKYWAVKKIGCIYHPDYDHMFADKELHDTASELGLLRSLTLADSEWVHKHPHHHTREEDVFDKRNGASYQRGREIYRKRRYITLQERLNVTI